MFTDIVFPKNNEKRFIDIAKKLGIRSICFIYGIKTKNDINKINNKIKNIKNKTQIKLFTGIITDINNIKKIRRFADLTLIQASQKSREIIEKARPDIIYNLENAKRKDFIYSRNSGLNQVLCKVAKKNDVMIGISINNILKSKGKNILLGRIKQNIRLCQKYKTKIAIASFAKDPYEMRSQYELRSLTSENHTPKYIFKDTIQP
jgi:RNase P/RNase MRP subunit p30